MFSMHKWSSLLSLFSVLSVVQWSVGQTQPRIRPQYSQQTQQQQRQTARPQTAGGRASVQVAPAGPPEGFDLPEQRQTIDELLEFWERKTAGIKTFQATFGRWVYDPVFGPKNDAATFSKGEIRYAKPDRGMIREIDVYKFSAEKKEQEAKWPYEKMTGAVGEHWVCDGKSVFEFNHKTKTLTETKLPPEAQGNAIAEGPLPFMFGAKAETIRARYWIREEPRRNKDAPFQLEMIPKRRGEDFSRVIIKLDAKRFLPTEMILYDLNKVGRSAYSFRDLKANSTQNKLANFMGSFVSPKTPRGWQKVVQNVGAPKVAPLHEARAPGEKVR